MRCWIVYHSEDGPILACCWYRPPDPGNIYGIERFKEEFARLRREAVGAIILGDLNVHCRSWLRHSSRNSLEGITLHDYCNSNGLKQLVREPTHKDGNLLDLILTDMPCVLHTVGPKIRDHNFLLAQVECTVPESVIIKREAWNYARADWGRLQSELSEVDWSFLRVVDPHEGAERMTKTILDRATLCMGKRTLQENKSTHP